MPNYSTILFDVRDNVARIALNRPEAANSLNSTLSSEVMDAVIRSEEDPEVRALVITGSGRFFCAGADLKGFYSQSSELKSKVSLFHVTIGRIMRADLPVIAAVNGAAAGAGMGWPARATWWWPRNRRSLRWPTRRSGSAPMGPRPIFCRA